MAEPQSPQPDARPDATRPRVRSSASRNRRNRYFQVLCLCATGLAIVILAVLLLSILTQGAGSLSLDFLTSPSSSNPEVAGVSTALVGTIIICLICAVSAIPLGVGTAVLIEEFQPTHPLLVRLHEIIETNIRNLAGVPSIVYGLLGIGAFVYMFNIFGPINNGDYAIGQTWYDQYVDATGQQLFRPLDSADAPRVPLYEQAGLQARAEVWRTEADPETGEETASIVVGGEDKLLKCELALNDEKQWLLRIVSAAPGVQHFTDRDNPVQPGDEVRFNPYYDETLGRHFYSSFEVVGVRGQSLQLAGGPVTTLLDAKDGSGKPVDYELVSRESLQPEKTRVEAQLEAFGETIREQMRRYRVREGEGEDETFYTRYPAGGEEAAVRAIVDQAVAQYPFDQETLDDLRPRLTEQLLALDGATSAKTRLERNRFIKVVTETELRKRLGGKVLRGQNPTRVDTKAWYHFALPLGRGVLAGGLTLMLVILPIVIVASQEALRAVPGSYRQGALALGATKWQSVSKTALPAAIPGICTGTILAISRAIGEAAPILVIGAAGYVSRNPEHLMDGFSAMPVTIFQWTREPGEAFRDIAAAGIIVLLAVLLSFNALAIYIRQRAGRHQS